MISLCHNSLFKTCFNKSCKLSHVVEIYHLEQQDGMEESDAEDLCAQINEHRLHKKLCGKFFLNGEDGCDARACDLPHVLNKSFLKSQYQQPPNLVSPQHDNGNLQLANVPQKQRKQDKSIVAYENKQEKQLTKIKNEIINEKRDLALQKQLDEMKRKEELKQLEMDMQRKFDRQRDLDQIEAKRKEDKEKFKRKLDKQATDFSMMNIKQEFTQGQQISDVNREYDRARLEDDRRYNDNQRHEAELRHQAQAAQDQNQMQTQQNQMQQQLSAQESRHTQSMAQQQNQMQAQQNQMQAQITANASKPTVVYGGGYYGGYRCYSHNRYNCPHC